MSTQHLDTPTAVAPGGPPVAVSPATRPEPPPTTWRDDPVARIDALTGDGWARCPACGALTPRAHREQQHGVCAGCGAHARLDAWARIGSLVDRHSFAEVDADLTSTDPLQFVDRLPYAERLEGARRATGLQEGVVVGTATIDGSPLVLAVMDFRFMGGSMGVVVGEKIVRAAELAARGGASGTGAPVPVVVVAASGGARMQEGPLSLWQMARTSTAFGLLRELGVPSICLLSDPVYGGVAASFASLADVIIAEQGARAGFAGPAVIASTVRAELPPGFQTAAFLAEHGQVDMVVGRPQLRTVLSQLLHIASSDVRAPTLRPPAAAAPEDTSPPPPAPRDRPDDGGAWQAVRSARDPSRPTGQRYVEEMIDGFLELRGDRARANDPAILAGIGLLRGRPVAVVAQSKGRDVHDRLGHNFGMAQPWGYRKAVRIARLAERWSIPLVTLIDTPGAFPGIEAEQHNQSAAIAEAILALSALRTPVVAVIIGEGGSGGALALATADRLLALEGAVLSVISPEGCSSILFGDAGEAPRMSHALHLRAGELRHLGVLDGVIPEPPTGAAPSATVQAVADAVVAELDALDGVGPEDLVRARRRAIRARASHRPVDVPGGVR